MLFVIKGVSGSILVSTVWVTFLFLSLPKHMLDQQLFLKLSNYYFLPHPNNFFIIIII
jgi:hypothetical protein